jgi:hypothetical protein
MNLSQMRTNVRRDLKDEDASNYRWTDDEIDRAVARAVKEFSQYCPREIKSTLATVGGSIELDISSLTDRVSVDKVEFPVDSKPRTFTRFEVYQDTLYFLKTQGDGENCYVYWTTIHTLDGATSTIPARYEDLIALGAAAYAALSESQYSTNRANYGGEDVDRDYLSWARVRLREFQEGCKKAGGKLRVNKLISEEY